MIDNNWWRHKWRKPTKEEEKTIFSQERVCEKCGVHQTLYDTQLWGRIVGWSWYPKVSPKCPKGVKP